MYPHISFSTTAVTRGYRLAILISQAEITVWTMEDEMTWLFWQKLIQPHEEQCPCDTLLTDLGLFALWDHQSKEWTHSSFSRILQPWRSLLLHSSSPSIPLRIWSSMEKSEWCLDSSGSSWLYGFYIWTSCRRACMHAGRLLCMCTHGHDVTWMESLEKLSPNT